MDNANVPDHRVGRAGAKHYVMSDSGAAIILLMDRASDLPFDDATLARIREEALSDNVRLCVDVLIANEEGKIFVHKRSPSRRLFPDCWEFPGGHVEEGESITDALRREAREETGMEVEAISHLLQTFDWEYGGMRYRNLQFLGTASGTPRIEDGKTTEWRWIDENDSRLLRENREPGDEHHERSLLKAFELLRIY